MNSCLKMGKVNREKSGYRDLTLKEEIFNSITHGIGTVLSVVALVTLVILAVMKGDTWHVVSYTIYGSTLILLYLSSTLYHSFTKEKIKNLFARFDHVAIFLLIAGTYTPFLLTVLRGTTGWILFSIIWGLALIGIVIRSIYLTRFKKLMVALYVGMGWLMVVAVGPLIRSLTVTSLVFLFAGGVFYSVGVVFYMWRNLKYGHGIWHLFVLAGSIMHFFAVVYSLQ